MKLARLLLGAALVVLTYSTASARIGETLEQCIKRYGAPDSEPEPNDMEPSATDYYFSHAGRTLKIIFYRGSAVSFYAYPNSARPLNESEVQQMLEQNRTTSWKKVEAVRDAESWMTSDGQRIAWHKPLETDRTMFSITTMDWVDATKQSGNTLRDPLKRALDGAETAIKGVKDLLGY